MYCVDEIIANAVREFEWKSISLLLFYFRRPKCMYRVYCVFLFFFLPFSLIHVSSGALYIELYVWCSVLRIMAT